MATRTRKEPDSELSNEVFMTLTSDQQLAIRSKLLEALANETNDNARNKIGDAVAEIARQYVAQGRRIKLLRPARICRYSLN